MGTNCSCLIGTGVKERKADILVDSIKNNDLSKLLLFIYLFFYYNTKLIFL
jgi:hypothetical protein